MKPVGKAGLSWVFLMAWRDMRRAKSRLVLFALAVVSGVAALVAINSFRDNLESEMDRQSRSLLGADVEYDANVPFSDEVRALIDSVPAEASAREVKFATMALFPKQGATRIVRALAMEGDFPWYGRLDTRPEGLHVADASEPVALVEDSIMIQFGLAVGDAIKIGDMEFKIIGEVLRIPGEGSFTGTFAPRVMIPMRFLEETGLVQYGSRFDYYEYQKFGEGQVDECLLALKEVREELEKMEVDVDTVAEQRRRVGRTLDRMNSFLSMVGFVALLLGGVAIAGAVQIYLKGKADSVATLRCLGVSAGQSMMIFCIQISSVGFLGCLVGALLGMSIQSFLPQLMQSFLPMDLVVQVSWKSIFMSLLFAWLFTTLFAFLPLLPMRRLSPLRAIRASVELSGSAWKDPASLAVGVALLGLSIVFTVTQTRTLGMAMSFVGGIAVVIALLAGLGYLLRQLLKRMRFAGLPFVWRQGLANLHRPNNRTTVLVVTLGMGAFLIYTIYLCQQSMLKQGELAGDGGQPNVILFDIQPDQLDGVESIIDEMELEAIRPAAIVTMRLQSLNGVAAEDLRKDKSRKVERWATRREYRSTYRDYIREDEELIAGSFVANATLGDGPVPISVEERIVEALQLELGDRLVWDVQGFPIETEVSSIRKVDWREMKPNFFVVFPAGVLEAAPAFFVTAVHAKDPETVVGFQSEVVQRFPNVSAVSLTMLLETLGEIFDKISFVIRFMASFTIVTGLIALMASVVTSRYQRSKESSLLRTLGASSSQIRLIMGIEYSLVGVIAGLAGIGLSLIASWAVTLFVLKVELHIPLGVTVITIVAVAGLTLVTAMLNSLGIASRSPMEAIRAED